MAHGLIIAAVFQAAAPQMAAAAPAERGITNYPPAFFADAQPVNAYDMVVRVPGFTLDKGQAVRGLAGSGGNVYVDGQPLVSKNDNLDDALKRIPAQSVERLELIRGAAPGIDLEGRSVVVNVVRRQTAGFSAAVTPQAMTTYDHRSVFGVSAEAQWRWPGGRSLEVSQIINEGVNDENGDGHRTRYVGNGPGVRIRSNVDADGGGNRGYTTAAYETPLFGGRARINGAYLINPGGTEWFDRIVGGGLEYEYTSNDREQLEVGARFNRPLTERLSLEVIGYRQNNDTQSYARFESPTTRREFVLDRDGDETVGRVNLRRQQTSTLVLEVIAEAALNRLDSRTRLNTNGAPTVVPAANVQIEEKRGELIGRGTWRATPELTVEAGVRQERSELESEGDVVLSKTLRFTKPRVAATWSPTQADQVRLRVEREVTQLNFDDFVAGTGVASTGTLSTGNPDIDPQQAWVFEAAYERRFWDSASVVLTARHSALKDVIDRVPVFDCVRDAARSCVQPVRQVAVADAPGNIGKGRRDELQLSFTLPLDRLGLPGAQIRGVGTRRWAKVTDPVTGRKREPSILKTTSAPREVSTLSPVNWEAHFTHDLPALNAVWGLDVVGGYRESAYRLSEVETKKTSTTMLAFYEWKAQPDLTLRVEAVTFNQRNVKRIREVYAGSRATAPIDYVDVRDLEWGGHLLVKLRKSFGG